DDSAYRIRIETRPPMMGFHRIVLKTRRKSGAQESIISIKEARLQLEPGGLKDASVIIGEVNPGTFKGDRIEIPVNEWIEICFKILGNSEEKTPIKIFQPEGVDRVAPFVSDQYFQAELRSGSPGAERAAERRGEKSEKRKWPDRIPGVFHPILTHIDAHGAITERTLIKKLGGGGKGARMERRFAANLREWLILLPFDLEINPTDEGKEYRKRK
ncbi:MAG: hypothetical protein GY859_39020, partial [Desulfobacterales bacterium]|nr:hypothetical protein [Desulfobacterales bacterium]